MAKKHQEIFFKNLLFKLRHAEKTPHSKVPLEYYIRGNTTGYLKIGPAQARAFNT